MFQLDKNRVCGVPSTVPLQEWDSLRNYVSDCGYSTKEETEARADVVLFSFGPPAHRQ